MKEYDPNVDYRYASIINNLKIIDRKRIKERNLYTINKGVSYLNDARHHEKWFYTQYKNVPDGRLRYYIKSNEDGMSYCEPKMKNCIVKYLIDRDGLIFGIQQVTVDKRKDEIERIVLYRR